MAHDPATAQGAAFAYSNYSVKTPGRQGLTSALVLGAEIRKERLAAELTQEQLAFKARVSRNYVSLLELDEKSPTVETLTRICKALGVKPSQLLSRIESK